MWTVEGTPRLFKGSTSHPVSCLLPSNRHTLLLSPNRGAGSQPQMDGSLCSCISFFSFILFLHLQQLTNRSHYHMFYLCQFTRVSYRGVACKCQVCSDAVMLKQNKWREERAFEEILQWVIIYVKTLYKKYFINYQTTMHFMNEFEMHISLTVWVMCQVSQCHSADL